MIQNVLRHIGGVDGFGVISICLFFAFFLGVLIWAFCVRKSYLNSMRELPLEDEDNPVECVTPCAAQTQTGFRNGAERGAPYRNN